MHDIILKQIRHGSDLYEEALALRHDVLRKPLGMQFAQEDLLPEKDYYHFVAMKDQSVIATAILVPGDSEMQMKQLAVHSNYSRQGVGSAIVSYCENFAREKGVRSIFCEAREVSCGFYEKQGYRIYSELYMKIDLPHYRMNKNL